MDAAKSPTSQLGKWLPLLLGLALAFIAIELAERVPHEQILTQFGPLKGTDSSWSHFHLMVFYLWVVVMIGQGVLLVLARFNGNIRNNSGVQQIVGSGLNGRKSLLPLAVYSFANAAFIILLAICDVVQLSKVNAEYFNCAALALAIIMAISSVRFWGAFDELLRSIWIESLAISSRIFLIIAMFGAIASSTNLVGEASAFGLILGYHVLYAFVYTGVALRRAPELLGLLEPEVK